MIHHGDCIEVMASLDVESIDAIVTDPPYGLEFMGMAWDTIREGGTPRPRNEWGDFGSREHARGQHDLHRVTRNKSRALQDFSEAWAREALRVAKPGAYLLAFGGTRTVHRMATAIEDAGWIIRDMLVWGYASGFPKSKASLKPAWEPIVMARKPGPLAMLAIDGCRIGVAEGQGGGAKASSGFVDGYEHDGFVASAVGRWPANVILTDPIFDGDTPGVVGGGEQSGGGNPRWRSGEAAAKSYGGFEGGTTGLMPFDTEGTYSRFFLIPKAARSDREPVLGGSGGRVVSVWGGDEDDLTPGKKSTIARRNVHPTVKPTELMRHLVRLVTPPGGIVLDPFLGSGTTALACEAEGFEWIGIEREAEYVAIAEARLNGTQRGMGLAV